MLLVKECYQLMAIDPFQAKFPSLSYVVDLDLRQCALTKNI